MSENLPQPTAQNALLHLDHDEVGADRPLRRSLQLGGREEGPTLNRRRIQLAARSLGRQLGSSKLGRQRRGSRPQRGQLAVATAPTTRTPRATTATTDADR